MTFKKTISTAERVLFVNTVVALSKNDDVYEPALYDYAFRICMVIFFSDSSTKDISQDQLDALAYSEDVDKFMFNSPQKYLISGLNKACREKISMEREEFMAAYDNYLHNKPWDEVFKLINTTLTQFNEQLDVKNLVQTIVGELGRAEESDVANMETTQ